MVISKGKMRIELEENIDKLNNEIEELLKLKQMLVNSQDYKLLYGKTQMTGEAKDKKIRSRLEHSQNMAQISQAILEGIYNKCATEEQKASNIFKLNMTKELLYVDICSLAHDLGHSPFRTHRRK